jgi:DNA-binding transcriptional MerR regulator
VVLSIKPVKGIAIRLSELSARSGVTVATIKYYLREGLLPAGEATAPNRAEYTEEHVRRLALVRALREVGALSVEGIRGVVQAIEDPERSLHEVLGVAHRAIAPTGPAADPSALAEIDALLRQLDWEVSPDAPGRHQLARALVSLRELGRDVDATAFLPYARAAEAVAVDEVASLSSDAPTEQLVEQLVVGTVVYGAGLAALRRLAQEHHSAARHGRRSDEP